MREEGTNDEEWDEVSESDVFSTDGSLDGSDDEMSDDDD